MTQLEPMERDMLEVYYVNSIYYIIADSVLHKFSDYVNAKDYIDSYSAKRMIVTV